MWGGFALQNSRFERLLLGVEIATTKDCNGSDTAWSPRAAAVGYAPDSGRKVTAAPRASGRRRPGLMPAKSGLRPLTALRRFTSSVSPMDSATADFYTRYARTLLTSPEAKRSAMLSHVERSLRPGASVLDVGVGSGRDVAAMVEVGFDAFGVEPSLDMLAFVRHAHPSLASRVVQASLPSLGRPFAERMPAGFDAVICSAVLMHIEPDDLTSALEAMVDQLRATVRDDVEATAPALLVSLPRLDSSRLVGQRDVDGRRFHNHDPEHVQDLLRPNGLLLERSEDSDAVLAETGTLWTTLIFRRSSAAAVRKAA